MHRVTYYATVGVPSGDIASKVVQVRAVAPEGYACVCMVPHVDDMQATLGLNDRVDTVKVIDWHSGHHSAFYEISAGEGDAWTGRQYVEPGPALFPSTFPLATHAISSSLFGKFLRINMSIVPSGQGAKGL